MKKYFSFLFTLSFLITFSAFSAGGGWDHPLSENHTATIVNDLPVDVTIWRAIVHNSAGSGSVVNNDEWAQCGVVPSHESRFFTIPQNRAKPRSIVVAYNGRSKEESILYNVPDPAHNGTQYTLTTNQTNYQLMTQSDIHPSYYLIYDGEGEAKWQPQVPQILIDDGFYED